MTYPEQCLARAEKAKLLPPVIGYLDRENAIRQSSWDVPELVKRLQEAIKYIRADQHFHESHADDETAYHARSVADELERIPEK